ncbi:MAG: phosphocholine cytidylyltransferase family protein [Candidatus Hydrogenedentota bacterium]
MSEPIQKAVILAAGMGTRLMPITSQMPKSLTEVNGKPLLDNTLEELQKAGISDCAIIVGYLKEAIMKRYGSAFGPMKVTYIESEVYRTTNSMYSTWLGREYLAEGSLLIEADCIFGPDVLKAVFAMGASRSCWAGVRFTPDITGSMMVTDPSGRIVELRVVKQKLDEYRANYFKSGGVLLLHADFGKALGRWLGDDVGAGKTGTWFEQVIARHYEESPISICDITGLPWYEIDDLNDLRRAEEIFRFDQSTAGMAVTERS